MDLLEQTSHETWKHSLRVNFYCRKLGQIMGLSDRDFNRLLLAASFHDIGKMEVSRDILQKHGSLTLREWDQVKMHPQSGYRIAMNVPEIRGIAKYILCHHEHWDGSGYPRGLEKEKIPSLCRILAVVDAYDAMTSDRSYRKSMNRADAIKELQLSAGHQFDPDIVRIFIKSDIPYCPTKLPLCNSSAVSLLKPFLFVV